MGLPDSIVNSEVSFGNFQCTAILFCRWPDFGHMARNIEQRFQPDEKVFTSFDDTTNEMDTVDPAVPYNGDTITRRILLLKGGGTFILEFYQETVLVQHVVASGLMAQTGSELWKTYIFPTFKPGIFVLGYELSIDAKSFEASLRDTVQDKSLHPVVVLRQTTYGMLREQYVSDDSAVSNMKIKNINQYLEQIGF
jgi:hypothetical protein